MLTAKQLKAEYQRRCTVDLLGEDSDDACNVHILCSALAELGQDVRVDEMVAHANWLAEAGLVEIVHRDPPMTVRATRRGHHVAVGDIDVRGVARPLR
ncbi:MAG: hypothetical protein OXH99_13565 [Bryobacterales bacterium]|nr:hypothetical protein [Bryobacterales bacterium]